MDDALLEKFSRVPSIAFGDTLNEFEMRNPVSIEIILRRDHHRICDIKLNSNVREVSGGNNPR